MYYASRCEDLRLLTAFHGPQSEKMKCQIDGIHPGFVTCKRLNRIPV